MKPARFALPAALLLVALPAPTVRGAVSNTNPASGETVTIDTAAPNPAPTGLETTATNVTVNVLSGAGINGSNARIHGGDGLRVNNAGTLQGDNYVVWFDAGGELNNSGTIEGGYGTLVAGGVVTINNTGTVSSGSDSTLGALYQAGGSFRNAGSFTGYITNQGREDSRFTYTIVPGSSLNGYVTNIFNGQRTLVLGGESGSDSFDLDQIGETHGSTYQYFNEFRKEGGSSWTATGTHDGDWTIAEGGLVLQGNIGGAVQVRGGSLTLDGGILGGDLTLARGAQFNGNSGGLDLDDQVVRVEAGATVSGVLDAGNGVDTLTLAGDVGSASFDLDQIGGGAQYRNFETFTKEGDAAWTLTGTAATTDWTVTGGTLTMASNARVRDLELTGGRLVHDGVVTVQDLTVRDGARVGSAALSSYLYARGDVRFDAGAVWAVRIDGSGSRSVIGSDHTIRFADGAVMDITVTDGGLIEDGDTWVVAAAGDAILDEGLELRSDFVGFDFAGLIDGSMLTLEAREQAIATKFSDPLAIAAARAVDADRAAAGGDYGDFITAVGNMTTARAEGVMSGSNPRAVAGSRVNQLQSARRFQSNLNSHVQTRRRGVAGLGAAAQQRPGTPRALPGHQLASAAASDPYLLAAYFVSDDAAVGGGRPIADRDSAWGGFFTTYGVFNDRDASAADLGSRSDTWAGQVGVDYRVDDRWLMGLTLNVATTEQDFFDQAGNDLGEGDVETVRVGPYVGFTADRWFADASLTFALNDNDATRRTPGLGSSFTAGYDSQDLAAYVGGGYDLDLKGWNVGPRAGLQYVYTWSDGYTETASGGGGGGLTVDDSEFDTLRATVGLGVSRRLDVGQIKLMPRAEVGYARELLDDEQTISARFVGGGSGFTVAQAARDRDSLYYEAGVTALLSPAASLDLGYLGESSSGGRTDAVRLTLRLAF